jgi:GNAT superfamily N-acetyltransferase
MGATLTERLPDAYPRGWETQVVLADGGLAYLRPVVPADRAGLASLHARLSDDSRYLRYLGARRKLPETELTRASRVDYAKRMAFVAFVQGLLVAYACYAGEGGDSAEVAFHVDDEQQGRGLGTLLLEWLAAYAHERGLRRFTATVLPHNRRMTEVFRDVGFPRSSRCEGGILNVTLEIDPTRHSRDVMQARHAAAREHARQRLSKARHES